MPEISVLLNNYNYGRFLGEAIASVLAQEYQDFELIIVDDGSTDNSEEIIDSFSDERIRKIRKANGGQLSAFNRGFAESRGKILCFLDSDDVYPPGYLPRRHFMRKIRVAAVCWVKLNISAAGRGWMKP